MMKVAKVAQYMSQDVQVIGPKLTIREAMNLMRDKQVRHLPVIEGERLVGLVSDRDVKWSHTFGRPDELKVEEVMTPDPYVVGPEATFGEVLPLMVEHKIGSVLVEKEGKICGVFTTIDALRATLELVPECHGYISYSAPVTL